MQAVTDRRNALQGKTRQHPFFAWLSSDRVPLEQRYYFAVAAVVFIMQFRDMSKWALPYAEPGDEFEWLITRGTMEDRRHSRLFISDWRALGLDDWLGWQASDILWWMFVSPEQEVMRHAGMRFLALSAADRGNPFIRFGHTEAGEATGNVFLSTSAPVATALSEITGREYQYFGEYHLNRENGHVANVQDSPFDTQVLDEETRAAALRACDEMFGVFDSVFDCWMEYVRRYVETGSKPARPGLLAVGAGVPPAPLDLAPLHSDARNMKAARRLDAWRTRIAAHPLYSWLRDGATAAPLDLLRALVPDWTMDILGYRDLARYALSYADPQTEAERQINSWAGELSAHSALFVQDWINLGLDQHLGLTASGTMEYIYLDPDLDVHRRHLIEFAKLAMRHTDPALRWWLTVALEATGEAWFAATRFLAEQVERDTGITLDYLAERHCVGPEASCARPSLPPALLRPEDEDTAVCLVDTVFEAMKTNLDLSYSALRARLGSGTIGIPESAYR